jgi:hypothetical protein
VSNNGVKDLRIVSCKDALSTEFDEVPNLKLAAKKTAIRVKSGASQSWQRRPLSPQQRRESGPSKIDTKGQNRKSPVIAIQLQSALIPAALNVPRAATLELLTKAEALFDHMTRYGRTTPEMRYRKAVMLNESRVPAGVAENHRTQDHTTYSKGAAFTLTARRGPSGVTLHNWYF